MILPIYALGNSVLRKKAKNIEPSYPQLKELLDNMYETMYNANGIGLAAPQIGLDIRVFITDGTEIEGMENSNFKKIFINPQILEESGKEWGYEEGCLSIPNIRAEVMRKPIIKIEYFDENFNQHTEIYDGMAARIIQHEYDHIEGILFTDRMNPLKRTLIKSKLNLISEGRTTAAYKMKFAKK